VFYAEKITEFSSATVKTSFNTDITGLNIPAMIGYHLIGCESGLRGLRIFGGGSVFLVTAVDAMGLCKDDFESPTYGVFAGAGVDVAFTFVDTKYELSLTNVSKLSTVDIVKNRSVYVTAGVRLPIRSRGTDHHDGVANLYFSVNR
jgi:hypothetical protein